MAERKNSTTKEAPSKNRQFHEDRNIPTIKVDIPMPKGAKPQEESGELTLRRTSLLEANYRIIR